jgi:flagellum-specific ATP synthase
MKTINLKKYGEILGNLDPLEYGGKVMKIIGLTIESNGPATKIGDICRVYSYAGDKYIEAEVVGFKDQRVLLMPLGKLEGIGLGSRVISTNRPFEIAVGEKLIGRVLDALGNPIDHKGAIKHACYYPTENEPPSPLSRRRISEILPMGIKAIDGLLTVGRDKGLASSRQRRREKHPSRNDRPVCRRRRECHHACRRARPRSQGVYRKGFGRGRP